VGTKIEKLKRDKKIKKSIYKPRVPALEQGCRVLLCLRESPKLKMKLTEISKQLGIHKSKGYSILKMLEQFGFVEKDPQSKTYSLGVGLLFLSRHVLDNLDYQAITNPFLKALTEETKGIALFGVINGEYLYIIAKYEPPQNFGFTLRLGHRFHFTSGAHGKAIVAFMSDIDRERALAGGKLHFYGDRSNLKMKRLRDEFAKCKRSGFAVDRGELQPGINAISAPVFDFRGKIIGCIILVGTFPESMIEEYGYKTANTARQVSCKFGADIEHLYPPTQKTTGSARGAP
jgi:IclR family KDG regulon transcriptional repressor